MKSKKEMPTTTHRKVSILEVRGKTPAIEGSKHVASFDIVFMGNTVIIHSHHSQSCTIHSVEDLRKAKNDTEVSELLGSCGTKKRLGRSITLTTMPKKSPP